MKDLSTNLASAATLAVAGAAQLGIWGIIATAVPILALRLPDIIRAWQGR